MLSRKIIEWGERNFSSRWRVIPFQPILYLCSFIGVIWVLATPGPPIDFEKVFRGEWAYGAWIWLMFSAPMLFVCSYYLIEFKEGRKRYRGYWFRFAASTAQFVAILTFLVAWIGSGRWIGNDYRVIAFMMEIAVLIFLGLTIVRDTWKLLLIESVAGHIRSVEKDAKDNG